MKTCPFCAEEIQDAAIVCKHCGRELKEEVESAPTTSPPATTPAPPPTSSQSVPRPRALGLASGNRRLIALGLVGVGLIAGWLGAGPDGPGAGVFVSFAGFVVLLTGRWYLRGLVAFTLLAIVLAPFLPDPEPGSTSVAQESPVADRAQEVSDAECKATLSCWGEKNSVSAAVRCRAPVERLAANNFEWTDGFLEPKFSRYRWLNQSAGQVTYLGDKIRFQNGFGAWIIHTYECDLSADGEAVLAVRAAPGQLGQ